MTPNAEAGSSLRKLAKNRKFEEMEDALVEAIEAGAVDREELLSALRLAAHRGEAAQVESILWLALTSYAEANGAAPALELARDASDVLPSSETIRAEVAEIARGAHEEFPGLESLLARTVLDPDVPLGDAVLLVTAILALPPGTFVRERGRREPGRVIGLTEDGAAIEIDMGEKTVTQPLGRAAILNVLPPESFHARAVFDREGLAALALEDPGKLVELLLRAQGREVPYRELRTILKDVVPDTWTAWWNEARPRIRRSPWIDVSSGSQPVLTLRRSPVSHAERVWRDFEEAESDLDRLAAVLEYLTEAQDHLADEAELVRGLSDALDSMARSGDPSVALAALALLAEIRRAAPGAVSVEEAPLPDGGGELLRSLDDPRLERLALELVRERGPEDWPAFYEDALPAASLETCEWAARELSEAGHAGALDRVAEKVLAHPARSTGALLWLWKSYGSGGPVPTEGQAGSRLMTHFLAALDRASRAEDGGASFAKLKGILSAKRMAIARSILTDSDREGAVRVRGAIERCLGLTENLRAKVTDVLTETHPRLFETKISPWERDDVIYTTLEGLAKKKAEYEQLVNERLPEVAREIGKAASFGDLSENAEYTAALETRQRLTERANAMQAEIEKAIVIPRELASGDRVNVGSAVRVRNVATGEESRLVFLGPWDGNVEEGVFYYRAPFAHSFMGKRPGDVALVRRDREEERFEILDVSSGLS